MAPDATEPTGRRVIGERRFLDGSTRPVFEDAEGRQYVVEDEGNTAYGVWLPPADEPTLVERRPMSAGATEFGR
jgi:hypothetical protein